MAWVAFNLYHDRWNDLPFQAFAARNIQTTAGIKIDGRIVSITGFDEVDELVVKTFHPASFHRAEERYLSLFLNSLSRIHITHEIHTSGCQQNQNIYISDLQIS